jgi:hypothetical protein
VEEEKDEGGREDTEKIEKCGLAGGTRTRFSYQYNV